MLFHKLAIGLGSLAILPPALKLFVFNWEPEPATVDIDVITAAEGEGEEMSTNVYQNGVLFGVWVAGVAISMGRLLSFAIYGGTGKNGIDVETQTDAEIKVAEPIQVSEMEEEKETKVIKQTNAEIKVAEPIQLSEMEEEKETKVIKQTDAEIKVAEPIQVSEEKETKVINKESYTKFTAVMQDKPIKVEELGHPSNDEETSPIEEVSKEGKGEGSKIEHRLDETKDKEVKSETKISVYKLPAIKRHHFMIIQDGMKVLRQSVQGKLSLEKITLDGVRNFIFIVAKGTPSQLSELESKVKADFRWLTPVRDPSATLTGAKPMQNQEPKWVSSSNDSRIPTRIAISPRARSPALRPGLTHKTPNPNTNTQTQK